MYNHEQLAMLRTASRDGRDPSCSPLADRTGLPAAGNSGKALRIVRYETAACRHSAGRTATEVSRRGGRGGGNVYLAR